jgi:hypothetical protein
MVCARCGGNLCASGELWRFLTKDPRNFDQPALRRCFRRPTSRWLLVALLAA